MKDIKYLSYGTGNSFCMLLVVHFVRLIQTSMLQLQDENSTQRSYWWNLQCIGVCSAYLQRVNPCSSFVNKASPCIRKATLDQRRSFWIWDSAGRDALRWNFTWVCYRQGKSWHIVDFHRKWRTSYCNKQRKMADNTFSFVAPVLRLPHHASVLLPASMPGFDRAMKTTR